MNRYWLILAALIPLSGCVSAERFGEQRSKLVSARQELETAKVSFYASDKMAKNYADVLKTRNAACAENLSSVQKSNTDLHEALETRKDEFSLKVSGLIKEKDGLSQKLSASAEENISIRRIKDEELAKALAEKMALAEAAEREAARVKRNYADLADGLKAEIAAGAVTITELRGRLTVNMVDTILFESGMAEVRSGGKKVLDQIGRVLAGITDKDIRIEGHTDNVPIGGELKNKYPSNWELSAARATAVARYLQNNTNIDPASLIAAGFGEYRPVLPNDTPEHKALNRRIEIALVAKE
ncbi:MAG: OmpA family protein [Elusimicrobiales bacterium]|nr:OmpA family protein [Elusimicrobiales bacterium]